MSTLVTYSLKDVAVTFNNKYKQLSRRRHELGHSSLIPYVSFRLF